MNMFPEISPWQTLLEVQGDSGEQKSWAFLDFSDSRDKHTSHQRSEKAVVGRAWAQCSCAVSQVWLPQKPDLLCLGWLGGWMRLL